MATSGGVRYDEHEMGPRYGLEVTRREGIEQGIEQGRERGKKSGRWKTLTELVKDGMISLRDAAKKAGMTEAEFRKAAML